MAQQLNTGRAAGATGDGADPRSPGRRRHPAHRAARVEPRPEVPQPATGVSLIGEYEASGYTEAPCLVRRSDGQTIQLTPILYATLELIDGQRDAAAIADALGERIGRAVSSDNVRYLVAEKLRPAGLVKDAQGRDPEVQKANPLLALRMRLEITSERSTDRLAAPFSFLFRAWLVVPIVLAFVAVVAWVMGVRGVAAGTRELLYSPGLMLGAFALMIIAASFHELGHAAGCRYSGGKPGVMGCGLYLVWPAFYTDVTDAYRLDRAGRLRTDLGGLYFNAIFATATFAVWGVTGVEAVLLLIPLQVLQMVHQLLPFVRMDGYHILSDLVGVPDLFARIKPTLLSFVPGRRASDQALVLKPWVRVVVTVWVLTVVPMLLFCLLMVVVTAPRVVATTWDSVGLQWSAVSRAFGDGKWAAAVAGALGVVAIALPVLGSGYALSRFGRRTGAWAWSTAGKATLGRPALAVVGMVAAAGLAFTLWPNGEYRPIQPGERGTVGDALQAASALDTGRPGLTPEREAELGGAPAEAWGLGEAPVETPTETPAAAADESTEEEEEPIAPPTAQADEPVDGVPVDTPAPTRPTTTVDESATTTIP
jgi:putative peptide zinc metalloprotease protein